MGHDDDWWERIRKAIAKPISAYTTRKREGTDASRFCGYVNMDIEEFEERLHDMGFERNPLSYWKESLIGSEKGSWRKCRGDYQIHTLVYNAEEHPDRTYVYAHWEYRWDKRPIAHLRGEALDITKGVNQMRRELHLASIPFYNDRTIQ